MTFSTQTCGYISGRNKNSNMDGRVSVHHSLWRTYRHPSLGKTVKDVQLKHKWLECISVQNS